MVIGPLAAALLGAWRLVSFEQVPVDGSGVRLPVGDSPVGLLLYTHDGRMSAQIARRAPAAEGAGLYVGYAGPATVDEATGIVTHIPDVSVYPSWVGVPQPRRITLDGDDLTLATVEPAATRHGELHVVIHWRRCTPSSVG